MKAVENVKNVVKRILTDRCDRRYGRIYSHALKYTDYGVSIVRWENLVENAGNGTSVRGQGAKLYVFSYNWGKPVDLRRVLADCGQHTEGVLFLDDRCTLGEHAMEALAHSLAADGVCLVYGDEDVLAENGHRHSPWLKPDWSPDLLLDQFYVGGLFGVRRELLAELLQERVSAGEECSQEIPALFYDLALLAGGYRKAGKSIFHCRQVLCHHSRPEDYEDYQNCKNDSFRKGEKRPGREEISIVIPSKDHPQVLERNLLSLERTVGINQPCLQIVVVDNGSSPENREKIRALLDGLRDRTGWQAEYLYEPMPFDFSAMCNLGADRAKGRLLLFLNDDVEAIEPGWLEQMAGKAVLPHVGAVGAKLLYPDSDRIQHAGIINLEMGPVHKLQFLSDHQVYDFGRNRCNVNVMAVTGACLMVEREKFLEEGGFSKQLPVAFNDVDLCFTLCEQGYYNVVMNGLSLWHHESLSRGEDESREKLARLERERAKLYERHPGLQGKDPYYHPLLNHKDLDTRIFPAPWEHMTGEPPALSVGSLISLKDARQMDNLVLRVERLSESLCSGYAFMIGDDNACYDMQMLWKGQDGSLYGARFPGKLRQDLVRNMPDQKNVGLCGFEFCPLGLSAGTYQIGILARNRVSGVRYVNWSNRFLTVDR